MSPPPPPDVTTIEIAARQRREAINEPTEHGRAELRAPAQPMPPEGQPDPSSSSPTQPHRDPEATKLRQRILVVFSGPADRRDGLVQRLKDDGAEVEYYDTVNDPLGQNILDNGVFSHIMEQCKRGHFNAAFLGVPCSSFSVARMAHDGGAPPLRSRKHKYGFPWLRGKWKRDLDTANNLVARSVAIAATMAKSGGEWCIENPIDRGCKTSPHYRYKYRQHCPLWELEEVRQLRKECSAMEIELAQCALGGDFQKLTCLLATPRIANLLSPLWHAKCRHAAAGEPHRCTAHGFNARGESLTARAAAYPAAMNVILSRALLLTLDTATITENATLCPPCEEAAPTKEVKAVGTATEIPAREPPNQAVSGDPPIESYDSDTEEREWQARSTKLLPPTKTPAPLEHEPPLDPLTALRAEPEGSALARADRDAARPVGRFHAAAALPEEPGNVRLLPLESSADDTPQTSPRIPWNERTVPGADATWRPEGGAAGLFIDGNDWQGIKAWTERAREVARERRDGKMAKPPPDLHIPASRMRPEARALGPWVTAGGFEHAPIPAREFYRAPPQTKLKYDYLQGLTAADGDADITSQLPWGLEDDSNTNDIYLAFHHASFDSEPRYAEASHKALQDDVTAGHAELTAGVPFLPLKLVPRGIVDQLSKLRCITDHSHPFGRGIASNDGVDTAALPEFKLSSGVRYARTVGILASAGVPILMWKRDAKAAYRQVQICPGDYHKCCYITPDGIAIDKRLSFGARAAPNKFQRLMLVAAKEALRQIRAFDVANPPVDPKVITWTRERIQAGTDRPEDLAAAIQYIDDALGVSMNDQLADGSRRGERHAAIFDRVFEDLAGIELAEGDKRANEPHTIEALGVEINLPLDKVSLPQSKADRIMALSARLCASDTHAIERKQVETLISKQKWLAHVAPEVNPMLASGFAMAAAKGRPPHVTASAQFKADQANIRAILLTSPSIPLVPRASAPPPDTESAPIVFQDACETGMGAFTLAGDELLYITEEWPDDITGALQARPRRTFMSTAELFAELVAVRLFLPLLPDATFITDFTDNEAARAAATRGDSASAQMRPLALALAELMRDSGCLIRTLRVTTKENETSDTLSRGSAATALRVAQHLGLSPRRIRIPPVMFQEFRAVIPARPPPRR